MTMIHHQPSETPLSRRIQRNSSGSAGLEAAAAGVGMPTLFSPRKRTSATSSGDEEYSGGTATLTMTPTTNDESEASDMNDFDAFGLSSPVNKPSSSSCDAFSPFEFSTANFDTDANFLFATTTTTTTKNTNKLDNKQQQKQPGFGSNDGFDAFPILSQVTVVPPLDEDASLNEDDDDDDHDNDCFSTPKPLARKHSSASSSRVLLSDTRQAHSTHGTMITTSQPEMSGRNPPSHSNATSSTSKNNRGGGGRRVSRSHHARPDEDEIGEFFTPSGNEEQWSAEVDSKSKSQSRKGSSRKTTTSSHKPSDEQPSSPHGKRSSTKSSSSSSQQRSHSVGRRTSTSSAKLSSSSGTRHRKSNNDIPASPSSSNEAEKAQQQGNRGRDGRPNLARSSSFSERKANRRSIQKSDHNPNEETTDSPKNRTHRGRVSEQNDSTKRRSHSESRRTSLSTKMSGGKHNHSHQHCPSTSSPSDMDQTTTSKNIQGRSFRRSAASLEMKEQTDILLSSPVSKGGSSRQERTSTARLVGRFHSDLGKVAHHEGRRPSRRLMAIEAARAGVDDGDEMMLSPGSKDSASHSGRRSERFIAPERSPGFVAPGLAFPSEDNTSLDGTPFTLNQGSSYKQPRGSVRASRRSILKEDLLTSPRGTDSKGAVSTRRLSGSIHSSNLANSTHTSRVATPSIGGVLGSPVMAKKSPGIAVGASPHRPVLERTPPAPSHSDNSAMRKRDFDPRLNNLLQKLRDPSLRDLNPVKDSGDDDDVTAAGIPVKQRGVFTRIAPMRHKSFAEAL